MTITEALRAENPYAEDLFKPLTKREIKEIVTLMQEHGFSPDRYNAHIMRIAWEACIEKAEEEQEQGDKCSICGAPLKGFIYYEKNGFKICRFCYKDLQMKEG